jgi:hypothetical protein
MSFRSAALVLLGAVATTAAAPLATRQEGQELPPDMKAMYESASKYTQPGAKHQKLLPYLGRWDVESTISMGPGNEMKSSMKAEIAWQIEGRFLKVESKGTLLGMPYQGFGLLGYDNFKQAFTSTWIDNMNTYKLDAQGNLAQDGATLIMYGTLDEYLTGENDKPVKYVYRWKDADHFSFEVHDLAIGETNTCVVTMNYARAK